jgi:transcriptional regulator with XRE-family HTH domain
VRRARNELAETIAEMRRLRFEENMTLRQIADRLGYKSAGTVSEHLHKGGYFSIAFNELEIGELVKSISMKPRNALRATILDKLLKR